MKHVLILPTLFGVLAAGVQMAAAESELRIGVLATLSGPAVAWGQAMQSAANFAAEDINAAGGLKVGDETYKLRVISYDDKYKPNDAVTGVNRLIFDDKIHVLIGPMGSAPALAVLPITTQNKLITMTMAFTPKALDPAYTFSFRPVITTEEFSRPQIAWVSKHLGLKRVGGLFPNDESGQQVSKANAAAYEAAGIVFDVEYFDRDKVDFVPLLTRLMANGIDALELNGNSPQTAGLMVKQIRELGFTGSIIRTGGDATAEIIDVAGKEAVEGMYLHQAVDPKSQAIAKFRERYQAAYKGEMNAMAPFFNAGLYATLDAMQSAGSIDKPEAIRDEMLKLSGFQTIVGPISWTGQKEYGMNHQMATEFFIAQVKDGQTEIVAKCTPEKCE